MLFFPGAMQSAWTRHILAVHQGCKDLKLTKLHGAAEKDVVSSPAPFPTFPAHGCSLQHSFPWSCPALLSGKPVALRSPMQREISARHNVFKYLSCYLLIPY